MGCTWVESKGGGKGNTDHDPKGSVLDQMGA